MSVFYRSDGVSSSSSSSSNSSSTLKQVQTFPKEQINAIEQREVLYLAAKRVTRWLAGCWVFSFADEFGAAAQRSSIVAFAAHTCH